MPELPEVEIVRRGIAPHIAQRRVARARVHNGALRHSPRGVAQRARARRFLPPQRRGKYILMPFAEGGALLAHLGMSGTLRICPPRAPRLKHDHIVFHFENGESLVFNDPRRFGCIVWCSGRARDHPLLQKLGAEPLSAAFNARYWQSATAGRAISAKAALLNGNLVAGVGNIYASEILHRAGVSPFLPAERQSAAQCARVAAATKEILRAAIKAGGATLRNFRNAEGAPGYFLFQNAVYGRAGKPCPKCRAKILAARQNGRATYYCPQCQPQQNKK